MESNQELFRQAILDAKAVRETSLATARVTLAEHFEPLVKSMFKETVEGIEEAEDETMDERKSTHQKDVDAEKAPNDFTKAELLTLANVAHLDLVYDSQYESTQIAQPVTETKVDDFDVESLA
jgi:hypothetical protein